MPELLDDDALAVALERVPGWSGDTDEISRTVELASFPVAIRVVGQVAEFAEEMDHHPDMDIRWRTVTFRSATHAMGGVTERDITLAEHINTLIDQAGGPV